MGWRGLWGSKLFRQVKLSLLCSSCRVRPLSESVNDLFREVSLLHRRITELSHRLATLEPILRRHGYQGEDEKGVGRAQSLKGEVASLTRYDPRSRVRVSAPRGGPVVRRRRVRVLKNRGGRLVQGEWLRDERMERREVKIKGILCNDWKSFYEVYRVLLKYDRLHSSCEISPNVFWCVHVK